MPGPLSITDIPANARVQSFTIDARPQQVNLSQALYSAFVEDTWRPTPSLTVVGGVRWDYDSVTHTPVGDSDMNNLAPRLGVSWTPRGWMRRSSRSGSSRCTLRTN